MGPMRRINHISIGIMIGMSIAYCIRMKDRPKPRPFRPVSVEQFEREQPPVLQKYGKLIVD